MARTDVPSTETVKQLKRELAGCKILLRKVRSLFWTFTNCPVCEVEFNEDHSVRGKHKAKCFFQELMSTDLSV